MDKDYIAFRLGRLGLLPEALTDALARAERHFAGLSPDTAQLDAWCATQPDEAAYLFGTRPVSAASADDEDDEDDEDIAPWVALEWPEAVWRAASPETKLAAWRELEAQVAREEGIVLTPTH